MDNSHQGNARSAASDVVVGGLRDGRRIIVLESSPYFLSSQLHRDGCHNAESIALVDYTTQQEYRRERWGRDEMLLDSKDALLMLGFS